MQRYVCPSTGVAKLRTIEPVQARLAARLLPVKGIDRVQASPFGNQLDLAQFTAVR